jgi:diaminobutyrate-2-oxoglutarate transaminase
MRHWPPGAHTSTFMGDAVNLAAGSGAIRVLRDERLVERSAELGRRALTRLGEGLAGDARVGEIRGLGLFVGIELVLDRETREPDPARTARIRRAAFERGVVLGAGGHAENVIKLCPPLTIEERLLDTALDATIDAIRGTA